MSRPLTRRGFSGLLAAGVAAPMIGRARAAGTTVTVASLFGADKPETKIWLKIKEIVDAKLPGRFDIRVVQNAALGGEKEVAEGIRLGSGAGKSLDDLGPVELGAGIRRCSTHRSCSGMPRMFAALSMALSAMT